MTFHPNGRSQSTCQPLIHPDASSTLFIPRANPNHRLRTRPDAKPETRGSSQPMDESEVEERDETAMRDAQMVRQSKPLLAVPCTLGNRALRRCCRSEKLGMKHYQDLVIHPLISRPILQ